MILMFCLIVAIVIVVIRCIFQWLQLSLSLLFLVSTVMYRLSTDPSMDPILGTNKNDTGYLIGFILREFITVYMGYPDPRFCLCAFLGPYILCPHKPWLRGCTRRLP